MDELNADKLSSCEVDALVGKLQEELEDTVPASYLYLDPTLPISPHTSDDEPASDGYSTGDETDDEEEARGKSKERVPNVEEYCSCSNCETMPTRVESFCCQESEIVGVLRKEYECVTDNPRFCNEILDEERLQLYRYMYGQSITDKSARKRYYERELDNSVHRHLAYKTFVSLVMCGQPLGKWRRASLPSCVVNRIRQAFPDSHGRYVGFCYEEGNEGLSFQEM